MSSGGGTELLFGCAAAKSGLDGGPSVSGCGAAGCSVYTKRLRRGTVGLRHVLHKRVLGTRLLGANHQPQQGSEVL